MHVSCQKRNLSEQYFFKSMSANGLEKKIQEQVVTDGPVVCSILLRMSNFYHVARLYILHRGFFLSWIRGLGREAPEDGLKKGYGFVHGIRFIRRERNDSVPLKAELEVLILCCPVKLFLSPLAPDHSETIAKLEP